MDPHEQVTSSDDDLDRGVHSSHPLQQTINKIDNSPEPDSQDDLDLAGNISKDVNLLQYMDAIVNSDISADRSSDAESRPAEPDKVVWSDDDGQDIPYKKTKTQKVKPRNTTSKTTRKPRQTKSSPSIVGKRHAPTQHKKSTRRANDDDVLDPSDDEMDENDAPALIKQRRTKFDSRRKKLGEAGLRIPPIYDDIDFSDDDRLEHLEERPSFPLLKPVAAYQDVELRYSAGIVPAPIAQRLRDYQVKGAEFLHELFVFQRGGLLGDDMGLGKTVQVISFLTAAFGKTGDQRDAKRMRKMRRAGQGIWYPRILVICPGSLMSNWRAEFTRWGWWAVDTFHGSATARDTVLSAAKQGRLEVMITTYTTYKNHVDNVNLVEWDCVIADECHLIKERRAEITKAMNRVNALCRIGLTGTAIQNKYDELWTLLNWTNPGEFGALSMWRQSISEVLKLGQAHDATVAQLAQARKTAQKLVQNLLPRFFLRRVKALIADQLPKKSDRVVFAPLSQAQAEAYENLVESDLVQYIKRSSEPCDCGKNSKRGWCCYKEIENHGKWQNYVFPMLTTLQKLSNHLSMLVPSDNDPTQKQDKDLECLQIACPDLWRELYKNRDNIAGYARTDLCGKWKVLKSLLEFWHANNDKVLVFSMSVRLLRMLQMLFASTTSYNVSYLDGSMSYEQRALVVDDFNSNPKQFVFLISTKAGGVGLNIIGANKVVIFDPNWNPSYDLQAQDRAYRIGQTRDVEVFRLVSAGTVEEIVYARQIYKQQQANIAYQASFERRYFSGVQDRSDKKGEIFGLQNIFAFQGDNVVLREIVNKTNIAESKAGVSVMDIDMEMDTDEPAVGDVGDKADAAISQLAALITSEKAKQRNGTSADALEDETKTHHPDAVTAILAGAGVEYSHENSEVVGSSRIETKLSERAAAVGTEVNFGDDHVFARSQHDDIDMGHGHTEGLTGMNGAMHDTDARGQASTRYKYKPPKDVRKRQFVSMAKFQGYEDVTEFALLIESWTQERRRGFLEAFYLDRRRKMSAAS